MNELPIDDQPPSEEDVKRMARRIQRKLSNISPEQKSKRPLSSYERYLKNQRSQY